MTRPMMRLHNTQTNEVIDREMNDQELAQYELDQIEMQAIQTKAETKAKAKNELLEKLGINEDEAKLLLS
jgi:hypothetical protein